MTSEEKFDAYYAFQDYHGGMSPEAGSVEAWLQRYDCGLLYVSRGRLHMSIGYGGYTTGVLIEPNPNFGVMVYLTMYGVSRPLAQTRYDYYYEWLDYCRSLHKAPGYPVYYSVGDGFKPVGPTVSLPPFMLQMDRMCPTYGLIKEALVDMTALAEWLESKYGADKPCGTEDEEQQRAIEGQYILP